MAYVTISHWTATDWNDEMEAQATGKFVPMIMSVGAGEERAVVTDGALAKATVMTVTLTCDHRVVDGATGAKWLKAFQRYVEDPVTMLL